MGNIWEGLGCRILVVVGERGYVKCNMWRGYDILGEFIHLFEVLIEKVL